MPGDHLTAEDDAPVLGLVGSAAGGVEDLRTGLIEPAIARGWRVAVSLTPEAGRWLDAIGEIARIEALTGFPVRVTSRMPGEPSPHPRVSCYAVGPGERERGRQTCPWPGRQPGA